MHNIELKWINAGFRNQLNKDIGMINKDPLLFISAEQTNKLQLKKPVANYCKTTSQNRTKDLTSF